jgi:hypothetical protein
VPYSIHSFHFERREVRDRAGGGGRQNGERQREDRQRGERRSSGLGRMLENLFSPPFDASMIVLNRELDL